MKISVIVPAYNEEGVIERCIKSVISQKFSDYELIIVNDGSNDKTRKIVEFYARKNKRVKLINHETPAGQAGARNHGAKVSKGSILFFLDADEWMLGNSLKRAFELFNEYKVDGIATSRIAVFPTDWARIWVYKFRAGWAVMKKTVLANKSSLDCPYIMTRSMFNKIGGFPKGTYYFEDYILVKKIHELNFKVLLTNKIIIKSDMGASFNDFFKRARNIGYGLIRSRMWFKSVKLFVTVLFFVISCFIPLLYAGFYVFFGLLWFRKTHDLLTAITAPVLFPLEKFISFYFWFREAFKKLFH